MKPFFRYGTYGFFSMMLATQLAMANSMKTERSGLHLKREAKKMKKIGHENSKERVIYDHHAKKAS